MCATALHPYFKLHYIKLAWGGAEEQAAEREAGNKHAKNWQEEALKIVEKAVSTLFEHLRCLMLNNNYEMGDYWKTRSQHPGPGSTPTQCSSEKDHEERFVSDYDRHRLALLTEGVNEDWRLELRRYLQDIPAEVT
jgi:hypothetical protein